MDENHHDKIESKLIATEEKLWLPPLSLKEQKRLAHLQKKHIPQWMGFSRKTFWDWLQLLGVLAIPLVVVAATIVFSLQQANLAQQQHENDQKIADQQHQADQQRALDQQEATILQTYIDNIQDLLLNHNLLKSKPTDDVAILARARTLTALQGLDPERKGRLVIFLYEAKLIGFDDNNSKKHNPIINLKGADLSGAAGFSRVTPAKADFTWSADLSGADLSYAIFSDADLVKAILSDANLRGAFLWGAHLGLAILSNANLDYADLSYANLN